MDYLDNGEHMGLYDDFINGEKLVFIKIRENYTVKKFFCGVKLLFAVFCS